MDDVQKRIEEIEKEIRETPYHKATEHHIGKLRAKLAKLKDQIAERQTKKGGSGGGFAVKQQGDATVVLVGFPSVGKSTLLNGLTNAESPVAEYAFTTLTVIPGMMKYKGAKILILDVPGLIEGASQGRGRGREVLSVVRGADLLIIMAEVGKEDEFEKIDRELYESGVEIDKIVPVVYVVNKVDKVSKEGKVPKVPKGISISAETGVGLEELKEIIWEKLRLVRVYLRRPGGKVNYKEPMIMRQGQTLSDVLLKLGSDFREGKTEAKIWGQGAKYQGQEASFGTRVADGMEVMFG